MVALPANLTPTQLLQLFQELEDALWDLRIGKYALLAALTLGTFYPMIITHIFDNLGPARPNSFCLQWIFFSNYWTFIMYSMMHWLVALRVYAYWGRSQKVFIAFATLWSMAFIATATESTYWLVKYVKPSAIYDTTLKVCTADAPSWIPVTSLSFLILEGPAFCLTAYKYRQDSKRVIHTTLINTLIQDGLIYFFIVVAITTGSFLFEYFAPLAMSGVARFLTLGIVDVTVSRLVLSLREAAGRSGTGMSTGTDKPSTGATAFSSNHRRGKSEEKGPSYPLDSMGYGEQTFVQSVPHDLRQDQTIVIGNPDAYKWDLTSVNV